MHPSMGTDFVTIPSLKNLSYEGKFYGRYIFNSVLIMQNSSTVWLVALKVSDQMDWSFSGDNFDPGPTRFVDWK